MYPPGLGSHLTELMIFFQDGVMVTFCAALAVLVRIFIAIAFYKNQFNFIALSYVNSIYLLNIVHLQ